MVDEDLSQVDLSTMTIKEMTPAQRAELRRRFESFVTAFVKVPPNPRIVAAPKIKKWVPGMK